MRLIWFRKIQIRKFENVFAMINLILKLLRRFFNHLLEFNILIKSFEIRGNLDFLLLNFKTLSMYIRFQHLIYVEKLLLLSWCWKLLVGQHQLRLCWIRHIWIFNFVRGCYYFSSNFFGLHKWRMLHGVVIPLSVAKFYQWIRVEILVFVILLDEFHVILNIFLNFIIIDQVRFRWSLDITFRSFSKRLHIILIRLHTCFLVDIRRWHLRNLIKMNGLLHLRQVKLRWTLRIQWWILVLDVIIVEDDLVTIILHLTKLPGMNRIGLSYQITLTSSIVDRCGASAVCQNLADLIAGDHCFVSITIRAIAMLVVRVWELLKRHSLEWRDVFGLLLNWKISICIVEIAGFQKWRRTFCCNITCEILWLQVILILTYLGWDRQTCVSQARAVVSFIESRNQSFLRRLWCFKRPRHHLFLQLRSISAFTILSLKQRLAWAWIHSLLGKIVTRSNWLFRCKKLRRCLLFSLRCACILFIYRL